MSIKCKKCSSGNCQHCIIHAIVDDNASNQDVKIEENNDYEDSENVEFFDCKGFNECEDDDTMSICEGYNCVKSTCSENKSNDDIYNDNENGEENRLDNCNRTCNGNRIEIPYDDGISEFYEYQNRMNIDNGYMDDCSSILEAKPEVTYIPKKILTTCTCNDNISSGKNTVCCGDCNDEIQNTPGFQIFCMEEDKLSDEDSSFDYSIDDICSQCSDAEDICYYREKCEECSSECSDTTYENNRCPYNCGCYDCPFMDGSPNNCKESIKGCICSDCECDDCPFYKIKLENEEQLPCPYNCGCDDCPFRQPKLIFPTPKPYTKIPIKCGSDTNCCGQKLLMEVKAKNDPELLKSIYSNKSGMPTCTCASKNETSSLFDKNNTGNNFLNQQCGCKRPECECSGVCKCPPPKKDIPGPKPIHQFGVDKKPCHISADDDDNCNTYETDGGNQCLPYKEDGKEESICKEIAKMKITVKEIKEALNKKEKNKEKRLSTTLENIQDNIKTEDNIKHENKNETNKCNEEDENSNLKILVLETKCQTKDHLITMMIDQLRQHVPQNDIKTMLEGFANRPQLLDANIKLEKPSAENCNIDYDRTKVYDQLAISKDGKQINNIPRVFDSNNPICIPSPIKIIYCQPCYNNSLLIRWRIFSFYGITGYEVFVDGELCDRIHSPQRNTTLIYNADPNIEHMITIFPMPNFYDNINDPCNCANPAKYIYEPKSTCCV